MNMKKIITLILVLVLALVVFTSCVKNVNSGPRETLARPNENGVTAF